MPSSQEDNFLLIVADPNWIKLGKHWYNQRENVAKAIDVVTIIAGVGISAKTSSTVIKLIRANRTNITRVVEKKITVMLDYADGKYDGYIFPSCSGS